MTTNGGRAVLFHNEGGTNHSLRLKLRWDEIESRRYWRGGAGELERYKDTQMKMLRSGSSYLSQSELVLTFGLGADQGRHDRDSVA